MLPKTPEEMYSLLLRAMLLRAYGDITTAARRKRLTEHDIATIERNTLDILKGAADFADEFKTFEVEPVRANALREVQEFFAVTRTGRQKQIAEQP